MTTTSFICMLVALVLLIIAIGRVQGSPKVAANLLIALAFGVVVGLGINSKNDIRKSSENDTKIEKISNVNQLPIQAMQIIGVTPVIIATVESVGKAHNWFIRDQGDLQQSVDHFTYVSTRASPIYEDSS